MENTSSERYYPRLMGARELGSSIMGNNFGSAVQKLGPYSGVYHILDI